MDQRTRQVILNELVKQAPAIDREFDQQDEIADLLLRIFNASVRS
jgi:hypothetical protein